MNLAQKIAVSVTLLAVAVFLFVGGHHVYHDVPTMRNEWETVLRTDWHRTITDVIGILIVGGVATLLLGIKRARKRQPSSSDDRNGQTKQEGGR